jgi:hypothetical protein
MNKYAYPWDDEIMSRVLAKIFTLFNVWTV